MPFSVQPQAHTTLYRLTFLVLAPYVVLVLTWWVFHSISLAARYRVAACLTTLTPGLEKIQTARVHNCTPIFALSPVWEKEFLVPSVDFSTADAFDIVCRLDRDGKLNEAPQNKKTEGCLLDYFLDKLHEQDFAVLFPVEPRKSWDRSVVIELLTFCTTWDWSRVLSRPVVFTHDFTLRSMIIRAVLDAQNDTDSLTHYNECPHISFFLVTCCCTSAEKPPFSMA